MKFTDLVIDGFGVWSGLRLAELSPGLNVFYGPNEAGKTTILEFTRGVLYGFTPTRRGRYLPPLRSATAGGAVGLSVGGRRFQLRRVDHPETPLGEVTLVDPQGIAYGDPRLTELLGDIDEPTFENVFALTLDELQQLRSLDGVAAARWLYDLSTGLDRVSLAAVCRDLDAKRDALLARDDKPSLLPELMAERQRLTAQLDQMSELTDRHWRLSGERRRVADAIARHEADTAEVERQARLVNLAISVEDRWHARAALDQQLAAHASAPFFPPDAVARLEQIKSRRAALEQRERRAARRRRKLRREFDSVAINEPLCKQAAKIHALAEAESWFTSAEQKHKDAQVALEQLEQQQKANAQAATITTAVPAGQQPARPTDGKADKSQAPAAATPPPLPATATHQTLLSLRQPARELRRATRVAKAERQAIVQSQAQAKGQLADLEKALADSGETDLKAAVEKAGQQASLVRRRVQLEDRLDRMSRHRSDLEEQAHQLLEKQILPVWILASLGGVFVLGVLMLLAGLFLPSVTGSYGVPLAVLGLIAFAAAAATKWFLENAVAQNLEATRKQQTLLEAQLQQAQKERDALDAELPLGGGSLTSRLQTAEAQLAKLEQLMPLEAERSAAGQSLQSADQRATQARDALKAAHRQWQAALTAAGLSPKLTPQHLRQLIRQHAGQAKHESRWLEARAERDRHARELSLLAGRIEPVLADAGVKPESPRPSDQIRQLRRLLAEQESLLAKRKELAKRIRRLRAIKKQSALALRRLERRRLGLFHAAQVADEAELVRRAQERAQLEQLRQRREQLEQDLQAACAGVAVETELAPLLASSARGQIRERQAQLTQKLAEAKATLSHLFEQRGQLNEQLKHLGDEGHIGRVRLELSTVEQRLSEAAHEWRVLAVTGSLLHGIRLFYERERQPETLRVASAYLARLTGGRYRRIWTPMEEDVLKVDDALGAELPVEVLSRGTREQLLLSLRLAIADAYRQRGAAMPLVLDDVLVNFDDERARLAAETLHDFAESGHQILLFTCHEHQAALFKRLGAKAQRLPSNYDSHASPIALPEPEPMESPPIEPVVLEPAPALEPPRRRKPRLKPEPVIEPAIFEPIPPAAIVEQDEPIVVTSTTSDAVTTVVEPLAVSFSEPMEPMVVEISSPPVIELPARRTSRRRADQAHRRAALRAIRHRWSAEEFDGELEDRVAAQVIDDEQPAYQI